MYIWHNVSGAVIQLLGYVLNSVWPESAENITFNLYCNLWQLCWWDLSGTMEQGVSSAWRQPSPTELVLEEVNSARLAASTLAWLTGKAIVNGSKAKQNCIKSLLFHEGIYTLALLIFISRVSCEAIHRRLFCCRRFKRVVFLRQTFIGA